MTNGVRLNIKAVAERTGLPLHTLRAWERRYGIPRPDRNTNNRYRLYDEQDIADILWMKQQVESGVSPAQASVLLKQQTSELLPGAAGIINRPIAAIPDSLFDAFARKDEPAVHHILNEAWGAYSPEQIVVEILQPALKRVGDAWQRNTLSVEQEHFASNVIRQRVHALLQAQAVPGLSAPRLVAACAPEEQHDLGLLIFAWMARRQGWNVSYLGQRTPLAELQKAGAGARFIVLSVSTVAGLASLLPLWSQPLPPAPLLFGGDVFNVAPGLREHIPGAFLGQDGAEAIRTLTTTMPHIPEWKPSRRVLSAAEELESERLHITSETVARFMEHAPRMNVNARSDYRHDLTHAALFLTDAVISALAFDAPELMDVQGIWANIFMPRHQVPMASLHRFLDVYGQVCAATLIEEAALPVGELVTRMAVAANANDDQEHS